MSETMHLHSGYGSESQIHAMEEPLALKTLKLALSREFWYIISVRGAVVHSGERLTGSQKVRGSNPLGST